MASNSALFRPLAVGPFTLSHRVIMAPLTRLRSTLDGVPNTKLMAEYYGQRACVAGTLIVTEATCIAPYAVGSPHSPGIWSKAQIEAWKGVTDAVHAKGSFLFCQLWAMGRVANKEMLQKDGFGPVSSSATPWNGEVPRALEEQEIEEYIAQFGRAAQNAREAGFDGVEIHGANGYLIDQFIQDVTNKRTDQWGGSVENRSRFATRVVESCGKAIGVDRVGIRFSPWSTFQGMKMENPVPQFTDIAKNMRELGIAYLHLVEARISGNAEVPCKDHENNSFAIDEFQNGSNVDKPVFLAGGFNPEGALNCVDHEHHGRNIAIVFGRLFIANPDLAFRIKSSIELNNYNRETFYKPLSPDGYVDYPFSKEWLQMTGEAARA